MLETIRFPSTRVHNPCSHNCRVPLQPYEDKPGTALVAPVWTVLTSIRNQTAQTQTTDTDLMAVTPLSGGDELRADETKSRLLVYL